MTFEYLAIYFIHLYLLGSFDTKQGQQGLKQHKTTSIPWSFHDSAWFTSSWSETSIIHQDEVWMKSQFSLSFFGTFHPPKQKWWESKGTISPEPQKIKAFIEFHGDFSGQWWFLFTPFFFKAGYFLLPAETVPWSETPNTQHGSDIWICEPCPSPGEVNDENSTTYIRGFPKMVLPQNGWFLWKTWLKWMIWGYHYFRKHPYI